MTNSETSSGFSTEQLSHLQSRLRLRQLRRSVRRSRITGLERREPTAHQHEGGDDVDGAGGNLVGLKNPPSIPPLTCREPCGNAYGLSARRDGRSFDRDGLAVAERNTHILPRMYRRPARAGTSAVASRGRRSRRAIQSVGEPASRQQCNVATAPNSPPPPVGLIRAAYRCERCRRT
jgi:hypothetical protein